MRNNRSNVCNKKIWNTNPRMEDISTGSGSRTSGASLILSTSLSNTYNGSNWLLNLAIIDRESCFGSAERSSSTIS